MFIIVVKNRRHTTKGKKRQVPKKPPKNRRRYIFGVRNPPPTDPALEGEGRGRAGEEDGLANMSLNLNTQWEVIAFEQMTSLTELAHHRDSSRLRQFHLACDKYRVHKLHTLNVKPPKPYIHCIPSGSLPVVISAAGVIISD